VNAIDAWDRYLGSLWACVLRRQRIPLDGRVVELGPGFSAKVGHGLAQLGFYGEVVLVEPNSQARLSAAERYRRLLPRAAVRILPHLPAQAGPVDLLLANHVLDDLFLGTQLPFRDSDRLFAEMRPGCGCSEIFMQTWRKILLDPAAVDRAIDALVGDLVRHVHAIRPGSLAMNQYPSWRQGECGLGAIHEIGLAALRQLAGRLERDLARPVRLRRLGDPDMHWLIST
jgi:hypothetical protein